MEEKSIRCSFIIHNPGYLADHLFQGKPVLPAVEAMEALAAQAKRIDPKCIVTTLADAHFDKFLFIDPNQDKITASTEFEATNIGDLKASLITRTTSPKSGITRTKTHAKATFLQTKTEPGSVPLDVAAVPEGILTTVSSNDIYRELVPFGPAYQNIETNVWLSPDGALTKIKCPNLDAGTNYRLGSPFALDAAFHAACVWSQHYKGVVAFPVAIDQRRVLIPTQPGQPYFGRIIPRKISSELLVFDIWLLNKKGDLCEFAQGVHMRDVSGGRLKPPEWIVLQDSTDPIKDLRRCCDGLTVIELDAMAPFAKNALSPMETQRYKTLGDKRKKSYLAARLALKRLFRARHKEEQAEPQDIETFRPDTPKPCCFYGGRALPHCSVSHDDRFAVAVTDENPAGVDVEVISEKAVKTARLYMSEKELKLAAQSPLGQTEAAMRVWSVKEAVSKATGMVLAEAWHRVEVLTIDESESRFQIQNGKTFLSWHATIDSHLFTLVKIENISG
jgi:phosphopantetheinyl transferase